MSTLRDGGDTQNRPAIIILFAGIQKPLTHIEPPGEIFVMLL